MFEFKLTREESNSTCDTLTKERLNDELMSHEVMNVIVLCRPRLMLYDTWSSRDSSFSRFTPSIIAKCRELLLLVCSDLPGTSLRVSPEQTKIVTADVSVIVFSGRAFNEQLLPNLWGRRRNGVIWKDILPISTQRKLELRMRDWHLVVAVTKNGKGWKSMRPRELKWDSQVGCECRFKRPWQLMFALDLRETFPDSMSRASHVRSASEPEGRRLTTAHTWEQRRDGGV